MDQGVLATWVAPGGAALGALIVFGQVVILRRQRRLQEAAAHRQQADARAVPGHLGDRGQPVGGLADDPQVRLALQHPAQPVADHRVVVGDDDPDGRRRRHAGTEAALAACGHFQVFTLAESLGGVESLVKHPGQMTHQSVAGSPLEGAGDLIRLSVGIEDADDLVADIRKAIG